MNSQPRYITVNQIGYPKDAKKVAVFSEQNGQFQVVYEPTGEVAFEGTTSEPFFDELSGTYVCHADFTMVNEEGPYYIKCNESTSATFTITKSPYNELHTSLLKGLYFLRCGMDLEEEFAGPWKHEKCHLTEAIVYGEENLRIETSGGWHDAGDYGKYIGPGAKALADLFLAYELYPKAFQDSTPIPETDAITPDVLHECRYELEWMLKMQDVRSGGVYHKLTTLEFPGLDVMPEDDRDDLYLSPISATATASFSAVMAMAGRIYRSFDQAFSKKCLHAAVYAWDWLQQHPEISGFKNPPSIKTGEYGDGQDMDERYWAAAELYRTTGEITYHEWFQTYASQSFPKYEFGWADNGGYGTISYLLNKEHPVIDELYMELKTGMLREADKLVCEGKTDGYLLSLKEEEYIWGSNMIVMNHAMILILAAHFSEKEEIFSSVALDHVHYLLGRNVLDICYVTGFGDRPVMNPHHRPSIGDNVNEPVPGFVSGGPNKGVQDEAVKHLIGLPPAQCFLDHMDSYSTNEITIYWNTPAVFVLSNWIHRDF
ncbi:glycoside hydrolase family 9 protein [Evansella tamaricis]|uniref:Glycoside hydrolase family 9 protein n=1 Tax=Evansella tamaricis TaxID=2069301 RepID=A0ABS6JHQ4_9BACI|nr:glycoside hydrolase family 9 protein [Evansella tamaricis]MBU9713058.1 glycoside hydrolase family 9 protein [Evansella tamaricis]